MQSASQQALGPMSYVVRPRSYHLRTPIPAETQFVARLCPGRAERLAVGGRPTSDPRTDVDDPCPLDGRPGQEPVPHFEAQVLELLGVGHIHLEDALLAVELDGTGDE
jgi:hypothetical protein